MTRPLNQIARDLRERVERIEEIRMTALPDHWSRAEKLAWVRRHEVPAQALCPVVELRQGSVGA